MMKKLLVIAAVSVFILGAAAASQAAEPMSSQRSQAMPPSTGSAATTTTTTLSQDQIQRAQQQLKAAGLYHGTVNGQLSTDTTQAVRQFQEKHGMEGTGILDQNTLAAIEASDTTSTGSSTTGPSSRQR